MNQRDVLTLRRLGQLRASLVVAALALASCALAPAIALAQSCDQLFASYDKSSWSWGALGNCKTGPGGIVDRTAIFECAFAQVPPSHRVACLRTSLFGSLQTSQGIDVVVAYNKLPGCDQVVARYDTSSWWWGALGNCKTGPGGITDRTAIFECAWAQVPIGDQTPCLKERLLKTTQTSQGIDVVVAYNRAPTCDELFVRYNNSSWWWGAFGNCKTGPGGIGGRDAIFGCAWNQVPVSDRSDCLKENLQKTIQTSEAIDAVIAYNSPTSSPSAGSVWPPVIYRGSSGGPSKPPVAPRMPCDGQTSNGQRVTFYFDVYCGSTLTYTLPSESCTRPEALKSARTLLGFGCYINETEGKPVGYEPPKPDPTVTCEQQLFKFCASCDNGLGPFYSQPSVYACTEAEALKLVKSGRPDFCNIKLSTTCP